MKKRMFCFSLILFCILSTGCVKMNVQMVIKKDKSMNFSMVYAIDSSLYEKDMFSSEDLKELENNGYTVLLYNEGNMKGITLSKNISNIDSVSSENDVSFDLSNFDNKENYMFKVKKGFLKNTYIVTIPLQHSTMQEDYYINSDIVKIDGMENLSGFSNDALATLDISFSVHLPYSALSSNATSKNDNNKDLIWNYKDLNGNDVQFEFELYNFMHILILGAVIFFILLILIFHIYRKKKIKSKKNSSSVVQENFMGEQVIDTEFHQPVEILNVSDSEIEIQSSSGDLQMNKEFTENGLQNKEDNPIMNQDTIQNGNSHSTENTNQSSIFEKNDEELFKIAFGENIDLSKNSQNKG